MFRFFKFFAIWLVVSVMVGLFTLWQWQQSKADVGFSDIVVHLLIIPTGLVLLWLGVLWGIHKWRNRMTPTPPAAVPQAGAQDDSETSAAQQGHAWILDAAAHTRLGTDPYSTLEQVRSADLRPGLDPELQDWDGLPVFSARVADLRCEDESVEGGDLDAVKAPLVRRAKALLQPVVQQLADKALHALDLLQSDEASSQRMTDDGDASQLANLSEGKNHLSGMSARGSSAQGQGQQFVQWGVRLLMPAGWTESDRAELADWLRSMLQEVSARLHEDQAVAWQVDAPASTEAWWQEFDHEVRHWSADGPERLWLVVAADSAIDASAVEHWQSIGALFTARHQTGRIPGEAAAGLLAVSPRLWSRLSGQWDEPPPVRVHRPVVRRREKSADAVGRVGANALADGLAQALNSVSANGADALIVVADADHRASRTAELFEALQAVKPGLDPMTQVMRSGECLGDVGVSNALMSTALACAAIWSSEEKLMVLAAHVQSSHERVVVALCGGADLDVQPT